MRFEGLPYEEDPFEDSEGPRPGPEELPWTLHLQKHLPMGPLCQALGNASAGEDSDGGSSPFLPCRGALYAQAGSPEDPLTRRSTDPTLLEVCGCPAAIWH